MKRSGLVLTASLFATTFCSAQDKSFTTFNSLTYGGAGLFLPSSDMKTNSMIGNGVNFTIGHYQSITKPASMGSNGSFRLGLEAKLVYSKFDKDLHPPLFTTTLKYDNGTGVASRLSLNYETLKKNPDAFHYLIGPSALMSWNRFFMQPSVLVGYASVSQEAFRFYDNIYPAIDPSQDTTINFYSAGHETNNGFVVVPGLKAGYRFTKCFAAFISMEYSLGSKQEFTDEIYKPLPGPDPQSVYDYYQMTHGTVTEMSRESKLRALMVNLNLALTLGKK